MIQWLVQTNLVNQEDCNDILVALAAEQQTVSRIGVKAFTNTLTGMPTPLTNPVVILGGTNLLRVAYRRKDKWVPGVWWNENFNFEIQRQHYGSEMLNYDAEVYPIGQIPPFRGTRFIRPVNDGKFFTGEIISGHECETWVQNVLSLTRTGFSKSQYDQQRVLLATPRKIVQEYRFFVVDGKVVTGSIYIVQGGLYKKELSGSDDAVIEYAQAQVDKWQPDKCFVLDVAVEETGDGDVFKILEINNLNSSGFYKSDVRKVIRSIQKMVCA